jgi:hypothetical protein
LIIFVILQASHLQSLFTWSIGERHAKNRWRAGAGCELAFTAVGGDRTWNPLVAKRSHPGEDGPEDRFRKRHLGAFLRLSSKTTNTTTVRLPVESKILLPAQVQQVIDQANDTALGRLERFPKSIGQRG